MVKELEVLFNVLPTLSIEDVLNGSMTKAEFPSDAGNAKTFFFFKSSYFYHLIFCKFGLRQFISLSYFSKVLVMLPKRSLFARILGIVLGCSDKKMVWINARRIISPWTIMAYQFVVFYKSMYGTTKEVPGPPMGIDFTIGCKDTISCLSLALLPNPASVGCQVHAFHKCSDRVWKLITEKLSFLSCDKHLELSHGW